MNRVGQGCRGHGKAKLPCKREREKDLSLLNCPISKASNFSSYVKNNKKKFKKYIYIYRDYKLISYI